MHKMSKPELRKNFTVFILFFGMALIEAPQSANWLKAVFWVGTAKYYLGKIAYGTKKNDELPKVRQIVYET
jgi:hypothetical protein